MSFAEASVLSALALVSAVDSVVNEVSGVWLSSESADLKLHPVAVRIKRAEASAIALLPADRNFFLIIISPNPLVSSKVWILFLINKYLILAINCVTKLSKCKEIAAYHKHMNE